VRFLRFFAIFLIVLASVFLIVSKAKAAVFSADANNKAKIVAEDEVINDNFIVSSPSVNIEGTVKGDVLALTNDLKISGKVEGNVIALATNAQISGQIAKDAFIISSSLKLENGAQIANLYTFSRTITQSPQAKIANKNVQKIFNNYKTPSQQIYGWFISYLGLLVVGLFVIYIAPVKSYHVVAKFAQKPWQSALTGILFLILPPVVFALFALTVIGLPLAIILAGLYILVIYLSNIVVGIILGNYILKGRGMFFSLALGLLILTLIYKAPFFGGIISLITLIFGSGAIVLSKYEKMKIARR